ncbi:hypothetical protein MTR67_026520 [Solanum verrucosum]|uniref:Uncharacterized protein n=1 Tax=Solanum verrucosum TaxID=315347 RepID=A0AAF0R5P0_SOLVR|nr:hypothetical protein MTR67_026520 [Solanum verrucosum]
MNVVVIPTHVAVVLKCQKNPLRALEIFNSVKRNMGLATICLHTNELLKNLVIMESSRRWKVSLKKPGRILIIGC